MRTMSMLLRGLLLWPVVLVMVGCAVLPSAAERRIKADAEASTRGWSATTLPAGFFDLAAWTPHHIVSQPELTIYIEGDGLAWLSFYLPSTDPTPMTPMGLRLALAHPDGNAAYLARPCQYVSGPNCDRRYWTSARFAPEVLAAFDRAIDALKTRFGARQLTLVGYSGGGAVAALLAERRSDVVRLVTVAGVLDHAAWTSLHRASPLTGSLNSADLRERIGDLPQWHFAGERDSNVPPFLAQSFAANLPAAHVVIVEGYDHACCWPDDWARRWRELR